VTIGDSLKEPLINSSLESFGTISARAVFSASLTYKRLDLTSKFCSDKNFTKISDRAVNQRLLNVAEEISFEDWKCSCAFLGKMLNSG